MTKRILEFGAAVIAALVFLGSGYALGFKAGREVPKNIVVSGVTNIDQKKPADVNFNVFWEAWDLIDRNYLRKDKIDSQDKIYGAVRGLVNSLKDPYTEYFTPVDTSKFKEDIQGNFGGIGAEIGIRKEQLTVIAPLKDTPAS